MKLGTFPSWTLIYLANFVAGGIWLADGITFILFGARARLVLVAFLLVFVHFVISFRIAARRKSTVKGFNPKWLAVVLA